MNERFHLLDQQIAKFTEFGVIVVFSTEAEVDLLHLRNTSQELAAQWPILRARINILVRFSSYSIKSIHGHFLILYHRIISLETVYR
jgi:hypothetical protein